MYYTCARNVIETYHLPQIAIMFKLNPKHLQNVHILHKADKISVDEAITILEDLPKVA